jgi:hypothetical protein
MGAFQRIQIHKLEEYWMMIKFALSIIEIVTTTTGKA